MLLLLSFSSLKAFHIRGSLVECLAFITVFVQKQLFLRKVQNRLRRSFLSLHFRCSLAQSIESPTAFFSFVAVVWLSKFIIPGWGLKRKGVEKEYIFDWFSYVLHFYVSTLLPFPPACTGHFLPYAHYAFPWNSLREKLDLIVEIILVQKDIMQEL